jgi:hypothetical protein
MDLPSQGLRRDRSRMKTKKMSREGQDGEESKTNREWTRIKDRKHRLRLMGSPSSRFIVHWSIPGLRVTYLCLCVPLRSSTYGATGFCG